MKTKVQYTTKVDRAIYSPATDNYSKRDWIELALAALDQAGLQPEQYDQVERLINRGTDERAA